MDIWAVACDITAMQKRVRDDPKCNLERPANCDDGPCENCEEEGCPCMCHWAHELFPENEFPSLKDTGIKP